MRHRLPQFVPLVALGLLAAFLAGPALAQRGAGQGRGKQQPPPPRAGTPRAGEGGQQRSRSGNEFNPRRELRSEGIPPQLLDRLRSLSPAEQERVLNNNRRFQNMPPERREEIRRRLRHWNSLTPQQQRVLRERERIWSEMSPEQRRRVREEILPRWQQLPPDRRQAILRRLHALRDLSESERADRLSDERFLADLSGEDRELLRELARLRVGPADRGPDEVPPD